MTEHATTSYVERSRSDRRVELAKLARDHHADVSIVVGLSLRLRGHQAHLDYTGGLDTARLRQNLASLGDLSWSGTLSRFLHPANEISEARRTGAESADGQTTPSWSHALLRAAPVDLQRPSSCRRDGETPEARRDRMRMEYERKTRDFAPVIARVNTLALPHLARDLLEQRRRRQSYLGRDADPVPLPVVGDPFFGSGHVFYVIRFPREGQRGAREEGTGESGRHGDGVQWIAKIPAAAEDGAWDRLCCETLRAEAFLLHMLREETGVPVPEVIDADCRPGNEVGAPWLLMEFVQGRRLEDVWFGRDSGDVDGHVLKERREKILRNVATAMLELGKYEFDSGGALVFDKRHGELVGTTTGPLRERDVKAMVLRWFADEDCLSTPLYCHTGPWDHPRDTYTALLDTWPPTTVPERGIDGLLRLLLELIHEPGTGKRSSADKLPREISRMRGVRVGEGETKMKKFVLTHPDVSMHNILLAEDGTAIKAIFGWDGARATPRSLGNEALPRWLVRDFNPFVWRWQPATDFWRPGHVPPECNRFEDPPWVLRELREFYASVIWELKRAEDRGRERRTTKKGQKGKRIIRGEDVNDAEDEIYEDVDVDVTKQSLLTLTLDAAIRDPRYRTATLRRLLEKCSRSFEELDFDYFVNTLGEGYEIDAFKLKCLANNVKELVNKGFVRGAVVW
ncbi:hypothetical protein F5Y12DRAFT_442294 [Xylaria sp. FL1777]|nr:hypothetical protein F5Y12DRAFT_442294 [Xylaria sp. FL1777]